MVILFQELLHKKQLSSHFDSGPKAYMIQFLSFHANGFFYVMFYDFWLIIQMCYHMGLNYEHVRSLNYGLLESFELILKC